MLLPILNTGLARARRAVRLGIQPLVKGFDGPTQLFSLHNVDSVTVLKALHNILT